MSVLDVSAYEEVKAHLKRAFQEPSRSRATPTQETLVLTER